MTNFDLELATLAERETAIDEAFNNWRDAVADYQDAVTALKTKLLATVATETVLFEGFKILSDRIDAALAHFSPVTGGDPTPAPLPLDANAYPLEMQAVATLGEPVTLGAGPDSIEVIIGNTPGGNQNSFRIAIPGKTLTGELLVTSYSGVKVATDQLFTVRGSFGMTTPEVALFPAGTGWSSPWIMGVRYNGIPLELKPGTVYGSRGETAQEGKFSVNVTGGGNAGKAMQWVLPVASSGTGEAPPAAGDTTLQTKITGTSSGGTLALEAKTYASVAKLSLPITMEGVQGQTIIDATGLALAGPGRGALVPIVPGCVFKKLIVKGAHHPTDLNGGGIQANNGADFVAEDTEITECDDGVRSAACNVTLRRVHLHGNGSGNARTHNAYCSAGPDNTVTVEDSIFETAKMGHELKSRAGTTNVTNTQFTARDGKCIECPNGGVLNVTGCTLTKPAGSIDYAALAFGTELFKLTASGADTPYLGLGMAVNLTDVFIDNQMGRPAKLIGIKDATLTLSNVRSNGDVDLSDWLGAVIGAIAKTV